MRGCNLGDLSRTDGWASVLELVVSGELELYVGFVAEGVGRGLRKPPVGASHSTAVLCLSSSTYELQQVGPKD